MELNRIFTIPAPFMVDTTGKISSANEVKTKGLCLYRAKANNGLKTQNIITQIQVK